MPAPLRTQILRLCAQLMIGHGSADWPLSVRVDVPGAFMVMTADHAEWADSDPDNGQHPPIVSAIGKAAGPVPIPAKRLASLAGYECNSHFRATLAEMVRNGLLRHGPDGYSLPD